MLIASSETTAGRQLLVIGLMQENIDLLLNDQPIYKRLDSLNGGSAVPGLEEWDVTILGPDDLKRFIAAVDPPDPADGVEAQKNE